MTVLMMLPAAPRPRRAGWLISIPSSESRKGYHERVRVNLTAKPFSLADRAGRTRPGPQRLHGRWRAASPWRHQVPGDLQVLLAGLPAGLHHQRARAVSMAPLSVARGQRASAVQRPVETGSHRLAVRVLLDAPGAGQGIDQLQSPAAHRLGVVLTKLGKPGGKVGTRPDPQ